MAQVAGVDLVKGNRGSYQRGFVSVVIPVWNSPELIGRCLTALGAQIFPRERFEVLVVDNGSTDSTPEVVRSFGFASLLHEPRAGSYRARNLGLDSARGEFVAFTDADCVPDSMWLARGVDEIARHPGAGILAGQIELFRDGVGNSEACEQYERLFSFNQSENVKKGHCTTANWFSPRHCLVALGGFNGDLKSGGDFDLSERAAQAGYPVIYVSDMVVKHPARATLSGLVRKNRRVAGGVWMSNGGRRALFKLLKWPIRSCWSRLKATLRASELELSEKVGVGGIVTAVSAGVLWEIIRLACGRQPSRS